MLAALVAAGEVRHIEKRDMYGLLPPGKEHQEALIDAYAGDDVRAGLQAHYPRFLELNEVFKQLCTDWQMRGDTQNDHSDADYDGGITGLMKIAHAAEGFGLDCEIHAPGPAHRHCMAAIRNTNYYELGLLHPKMAATSPPVFLDYSDEIDSIDARGHVAVPTGPGLGVQLNWDFIKSHSLGVTVYE